MKFRVNKKGRLPKEAAKSLGRAFVQTGRATAGRKRALRSVTARWPNEEMMISIESMKLIIEQKFVERAQDLARTDGHKNIDELITLKGGRKIPVWKFYMTEAASLRKRPQSQ
jgi:hypothetical protein